MNCRLLTETKPQEQQKSSKSKEINFDSDSDLPGLDNHEVSANQGKKKTPAKRGKGKKEKNDDLFGDDDDLPGIQIFCCSSDTKYRRFYLRILVFVVMVFTRSLENSSARTDKSYSV